MASALNTVRYVAGELLETVILIVESIIRALNNWFDEEDDEDPWARQHSVAS